MIGFNHISKLLPRLVCFIFHGSPVIEIQGVFKPYDQIAIVMCMH